MTSQQLVLAQLPSLMDGHCEVSMLGCSSGVDPGIWPAGRWGASLTTLGTAHYLYGGWANASDAGSPIWCLRLREAAVEWTPLPHDLHSPPSTAFHTATALEDGKTMAVVGGLGGRSSSQGIWLFHSSTGRWSIAAGDGPSLAGHAAGCVEGRLALFGGVQRAAGQGDVFSGATSLFDLRAGRWDVAVSSTLAGFGHGRPAPRRNPVSATLGHHLIVSGGWSDDTSISLNDTWALDVRRGIWNELPCGEAPRLEGHKGVLSGLDLFTFGGQVAPGHYSEQSMVIHRLSLGWVPATSARERGPSSLEAREQQATSETRSPKEGCNEGSI